MTHKEILKLFIEHNIEFVVVGGVALRLYNSPRVTHDIDIAAKTLDLDKIIPLMYKNSYYLITKLKEDSITVALNGKHAEQWVERTKSGSISFVSLYSVPQHSEVQLKSVDIASQIDILFELGIPIMRLKENSRIIELQDISFRVASVDDLITLKEQRSDKSWTDEEDIRYLKSLKESNCI